MGGIDDVSRHYVISVRACDLAGLHSGELFSVEFTRPRIPFVRLAAGQPESAEVLVERHAGQVRVLSIWAKCRSDLGHSPSWLSVINDAARQAVHLRVRSEQEDR